jgi:pSer/pThr/pTyr-binding forkhead associated (FHA) protein
MHVDARRKLIVTDSHGERDVLFVGTLTVGRDPGCEISVADPLLSRHHAEFVESSSGVLVRDLHSQNGIKVNNVVVKEAALQAGDIVQIAGLSLRYVEEAAPPLQNQEVAEPVKDDRTVAMPSPPTFSKPLPPASAAPPVVPDAPPVRSSTPPAGFQEPQTNPMAPPPRPASVPPAAPPPALASTHPAAPPSAPPSAASSGSAADDDRTRAMAPPVMSRPPQPQSAPPSAPPRQAPGATSPPAARPSARPAASAPPPPAPVASAKPAAPAVPAKSAKAAKAVDDDAAPRPARAARSSWGARVLWQVLLLSLIISVGSAVPLMLWHNQQMNAVGVSRATAIVNWLAAEAATALSTGRDVTLATEEIAGEPGVVSARVLMSDGRVIAPAARSAERVEYIPGIDATPGDVLRLRTGWNGGELEIVRPIAANGNPRAAIAWVTIRPTSEFGGSSAVVTAPIVLVSVLIGWIVAILITRSTLRSLNSLNEDVELALSGRLDAVADPLGARPVRDLADTISYLVARLRGSGIDTSRDRAPHPAGAGRGKDSSPAARGEASQLQSASPNPSVASASRGAAQPAAPRAPAPPPAPKVLEARLIANASFVVTEAGPGCADVLGVRADALVGKHLLDAILDSAIAEAVLGCFSNLPAEGERQATVADGQGRQLDVTVTRAGKDQPIAIVLRVERAS